MKRLLSLSFIIFCTLSPFSGCGSGGGSSSKLETPIITWAAPAAISYGTALSATQLDATANYPGSFSYSPGAGTLLSVGTQTLSVTFTPNDPTTVASASASTSLTVTQATPVITWNTPAAVVVGTALSSTQLDATAGSGGTSVPGKFVYTPGAGTVMNTVGTQTLSVQFTPTDGTDYNSATGSVSLSVTTSKTAAIAVNINTLANRHQISPFVYGNNDQTISDISDIGYTFSRWGGNDISNYNYVLQTRNSASDWYFEDYGGAGDNTQLIKDTQSAGSHSLTSIALMDWVAAGPGNWSYSIAKYGSQCSFDPWNTDAGNGQKTDCSTPVTTDAVTTAYYPLVDTATDCPSGTTDGSTCVDRETWATAMAAAFNTSSATCPVPNSSITSCHFYDMDNEPDIWNGTHRDVHPAPAGYDELANVYEKEATNLKKWDPEAVRFGPVFCCWWFYWNGANGADKGNHGGVDFLPWWLNQVKWLDEINGARTLDVFDIHEYANAPSTTGFTNAQLQALTAKIAAYYWDPTFAPYQGWTTTSIQPNQYIAFSIPRFKAMLNAIYPGTPLAYSEWGYGAAANVNGEPDFSTAIADADSLGVFGREGLSFASRWGGPSSSSPQNAEYLAWKIFTNYDGAHHQFNSISVSDQNNGTSDLFTSYAALDSAGTTMTILVLNKDPNNTAQVDFNLTGFNASTYAAYTLSSTNPSSITSSGSAAWNSSQNFAPYSITLLVVSGSESSKPASEWFLNPDDLMIPAAGTATLHPAITSGSATVTLSSAVFDAYDGAAACSGTLALTNALITATQPAIITVNAGSSPGFCHYTVTGNDGTATQTQGGWIVVGNPPATLTQSGNNQSGSAGSALSLPLTVTLNPGQSGGSANGADILFTTSAGTLSYGTTSGSSVIAQTNSSGVASVTLTLPSSKGAVTVTAQDQFPLGGASVIFKETAN
ncbi:MAG: glycoside hydrolase family 44 protein [Terracidiphilus sp.]